MVKLQWLQSVTAKARHYAVKGSGDGVLVCFDGLAQLLL